MRHKLAVTAIVMLQKDAGRRREEEEEEQEEGAARDNHIAAGDEASRVSQHAIGYTGLTEGRLKFDCSNG